MLSRQSFIFNFVELIRIHHWIKNVFVIVPIFFSGKILELESLKLVVQAALIFCFLSSAIYIINDLRDCEADKLHIKKSKRPLPSGRITKIQAIMTIIIFLTFVIVIATSLNPPPLFIAVIVSYLFINIGYSLLFKHYALIELLIVSSGYMLRLVGGDEVIQEPLSSWIIACTGLIALLLTIGKRRGDIAQGNDPSNQRRSLQKYSVYYLDHTMTMISSSTIVTYLLFTMSDYAQHRFGHYIMWSSVLVIFGIMRYLQIIFIENGGDSPTALIYKDRWIIGAIILYIVYFVCVIYFR